MATLEERKTSVRPHLRLKLDQIHTNAKDSASLEDAVRRELLGMFGGNQHFPEIALDEVFGRALHFSDDHYGAGLCIPNSQDLAAASRDNGFTLAMWLKPEQVTETATVLSRTADADMWGLRAGANVEFLWRANGAEDAWHKLVGPDPLVAGAWTHVAVSINEEEAKLFINGTLASRKAGSSGLRWSNDPELHLGQNSEFDSDLKYLQHVLTGAVARKIEFVTGPDRTTYLITADDASHATLWDVQTGHLVRQISVGIGPLTDVQFDRSGALVVCGAGGVACIPAAFDVLPMDSEPSEALARLASVGQLEIRALAHDRESAWMIATEDGTVAAIEGIDDWLQWNLPVNANALAYDPVGEVYLAAFETDIALAELHRGRLEKLTGSDGSELFLDHGAYVADIATPTKSETRSYSEDQIIAWASLTEKGQVQLWGGRLHEGRTIGDPERVLGPDRVPITFEFDKIQCMAFSHDGEILATAGQDGVVLLWDTRLGRPWGLEFGDEIVFEHEAPVSAIAISADKKTLATAGEDGLIKIWKIEYRNSVQPNYRGGMANLRLYGQALAQDEVEDAAAQDLPEIQVGTIFPLDFSLHNNQQQHVLFLVSDPQQLHLDVTNVGRRNVMLPTGNDKPEDDKTDPAEGILEIRFRPGTLMPDSKIFLASPDADRPMASKHVDDSANWRLTQKRDADGSDVLHLERRTPDGSDSDIAAATLLPGETLYLTLGGLLANVKLGSHSTRVQLKYRLHYDDNTPLYGSRLHYLRLLNMSDSDIQKHVGGLLKDMETKATSSYVDTTVSTQVMAVKGSLDQRMNVLDGKVTDLEGKASKQTEFDRYQYHLMQREYFKHGGPLVASVVGVASLINDGTSTNRLTLRIDNRDPRHPTKLSTDRQPTFKVTLFDANNPDTSLLDRADIDSTSRHPDVSDGWDAQTVREDHGAFVTITWQNSGPNQTLEALDLTLETTCSAASGTAYVVITYENIGEGDETGKTFEGWMRVPVERSPMIAHDKATLASGSLNLVDSAYLGLHRNDVQSGFNTSRPQSALALDDKGALEIASTDAISLFPGATPTGEAMPTGTHGFVVSKDSQSGPVQARLDGNLSASGAITAAAAVSAASANVSGDIQVAGNVGTAQDLTQGWSSLVPRGAIIMWHGTQLPPGWALCNGANGTPDLRSRFIVGASPQSPGSGLSAYELGNNETDYRSKGKGGAEHVTLSKNEMPWHDHNWSYHDPGHSHGVQALSEHHTDNDDDSLAVWAPSGNTTTGPSGTGITFTHNPEGGDGQHENRPPYYALYYIMKL